MDIAAPEYLRVNRTTNWPTTFDMNLVHESAKQS